ncbi:OmpA family protein [Roseomonas sp. CCTCC AB2023176]|uniref:OmpA family protein n=1 Tax=Roseomonas sp. CCTCC AB2023176 TaxID=3342640 RepID=UPI0035D59DAC
MPRLRSALLATAFVGLPLAALPLTAAVAQPVSGLYIAGGGGANWLQSTESSIPGQAGRDAVAAGLPNRGTVEWEVGFVGLVSVGYGFGNGLRLEIEGNYRRNEFESSFAAGQTSRRNDGNLYQIAGMANLLYDIAIPGVPVTPYIGGGIGYSHVFADGVVADFRPNRSQVVVTDDDKGVFAYQAIAGAAINLGVPNLALTAEYRFFGTTEVKLSGFTQNTNTGVRTPRSGSLENLNHSVLVGLRYAFNAPRPAPAAAQAGPAVSPAVARTYLVFFDWDRADLTDRARQIVAEAANASRTANVTRIEVAGHADRSGTPQYNQRLSQRRAEVVAAELARNGVARQNIVVQAFGESRPLVPTADGVREPQNRRVEIVLR